MILETGNKFAPTLDSLFSVENGLLSHTSGSLVIWFGRAATALHWAYRLLLDQFADAQDIEIIMPATMCGTPANTALLAGTVPRFADVDPSTGLMTLESIQERLTSRTCAVVIVHLLGQALDVKPIAEWCRQHGLFLIEDLAQATGAKLPDGQYAGTYGDLVIYSFNQTKILENGNGALVLRHAKDQSALENLFQNEPLPTELPADTRAQLGLSYRNLHHSLIALLRLGKLTSEDASQAFLSARPAYDELYHLPAASDNGLDQAWEDLENTLSRRAVRATQYHERLTGGPWQLVDGWQTSGVCWRYTLLIDSPSELFNFSERVRKDGFHVSNLYWPANDLFRPSDICPSAEYFARRVVNLWVDDTVDEQWIDRRCDSLWSHARNVQPTSEMLISN